MSKDQLIKYSKLVNIAQEIDEEELNKIGKNVLIGYEEDKRSMTEWLSDVQKVEELTALSSKKKSTPLPNSANVKLPLITKACLEFASTTYPEIIKDDKVVKAKVLGMDDNVGTKMKQGQRVVDFMNYQLLFENTDWELELDRILNLLPIIGFICKKVYYDPIRKINKSEICDYKELFIHADVKSLDDASRISQIIHLRLNDFVEYKNTKIDGVAVYLSKPVDELCELHKADVLDPAIDVIEQHCKLDLDKDGYAEPYIVTVTKDLGRVLRIAPRFREEDICEEDHNICYIIPVKYFVDYHFLVSPKGKFQSVGFGLLLLQLTDSCNSIMNQLIDAGQLANMQGGYRDARCKIMPSGNSLHDPGEWKEVKVETGGSLKEGIVPINYKEPSSVLYQLLNTLLEVSRDLTSSAQINNGTQSSANAKTGATVAIQNEGKKTHNAILKRFYRSLNQEFKQLFKLNSMYLKDVEYRNVMDTTLAVKLTDFDESTVNIIPVADPNLSSETDRIVRAQFVQSLIAQGLPGIDPLKATKFILSQSNIPNIESILSDEKTQQPPNVEMLKFQAETEGHAQELNIKGAELQLKQKQQIIDAHLAEAQVEEMKAAAIQNLAKAESEDAKNTLANLKIQLDAISQAMDTHTDLAQMQHEKDMQTQDQVHEQQQQDQQHAHEQDITSQEIEAQPNENDGSGGVAS